MMFLNNPRDVNGKLVRKDYLNYTTIMKLVPAPTWKPVLRTIFRNGKLLVDEDYNTIRDRVRSYNK